MPATPDPVAPTRCPWLWLMRRPGAMLLVAHRERFASQPAHRFRWAWVEVLLISIGWGLASVGVWDLATRVVASSSGVPLVPAGLVMLLGGTWLYRRGLVALGRLAAPEETSGAAVVAALVAIFWLLCLLDLPGPVPSSRTVLPAAWRWLRPLPWYRVLLLGPVWGAWAMLITCQFCRPSARTQSAVRGLARGCGPAAAALAMALPLGASLYYFNHLSWWQPTISAAAVLTATGGGVFLCRLFGGLRREALLAVNVLTQIVFTFAYLVNRSFA